MIRNKFATVVGIALLVPLALTACTTSQTPQEGEVPVTEQTIEPASSGPQNLLIAEISSENIDLDSFVDKDWYATVDGATITYNAGGSGTCKPIIETAVYQDNKVVLTRPDYSGRPCTMDMRYFTQTITAPDGVVWDDTTVIEVIDPNIVQ